MPIRMIAAALLVMACAAAAEPGRELSVVVLDPDGKPLPGANVTSGLWTDDKDFAGSRDRLTHADSAHKSEPQVTFCDQRKGFLHKTKPPVTFRA